jgi:predicted metal-dependent TIM-barrel fold hydrolase
MSTEAMKQALDALVEVTGWQSLAPRCVWDEAIAAIRVLEKAIAETDKQEPVAWLDENEMKAITDIEKQAWIQSGRDELVKTYNIPLYIHAQPKKKEEALQQDNWQQYAKEGETAQDVIERERADCAALLELYKKLKQQL